MKTLKQNLILLSLAATSFVLSCDDDSVVEDANSEVDLISNTFPEYQTEIKSTLDGIFTAVQNKDADKLVTFHAYGPKFTQFINGAKRVGSDENEAYERGLLDAISGFEYDLNDLKIAVYGEVAVVTFHADFRPKIGEDQLQSLLQTTLVFVRMQGEWKIVHEHDAPLTE